MKREGGEGKKTNQPNTCIGQIRLVLHCRGLMVYKMKSLSEAASSMSVDGYQVLINSMKWSGQTDEKVSNDELE